MKKLIGVLFVVFGLCSGSGWAFDLSVVGGANSSNPSFASGATVNVSNVGSKIDFSYGALAGIDVGPGVEVETGLLVVSQHVSATTSASSNNALDQSFRDLEVPVVIRYTALPVVSFGAGLAYQIPVGSVTANWTDSNGQAKSDSTPVSGVVSGGLNAVFDARAGLPILPTLSAIADLRYLQDLNSRNGVSGGASEKFNNLRFMAGLTFTL